jgi:hypothetical protein
VGENGLVNHVSVRECELSHLSNSNKLACHIQNSLLRGAILQTTVTLVDTTCEHRQVFPGRNPWGAPQDKAAQQQGGYKMDLTGLLVQVISGAIGGSAAGAAAKDYSVGALGNAIAGAIGGGIVGQLVGTVAGQAIEGWVGNIGGGAIGGVILTLLVGLIRNYTQKNVGSQAWGVYFSVTPNPA